MNLYKHNKRVINKTNMDKILEHVHTENVEWVSQLNPQDIAQILNTLSMIPSMQKIYTESKDVSVVHDDHILSELPANVGKAGEATFENIISQYMPGDYKLEDTAKQGYKGDFSLTWCSYKTNKQYKILIDVKNYKTTVPQKEIDKFYRDIKLNSNYHGGLLLSLNSKIVGFSKIIEFKDIYSNNNMLIPLVIVKSSQPETICEIIKLLFHTIEIKETHDYNIGRDGLIIAISDLSDQIQLITDCRNNLQNSKTEIEKNINDIMFKLMQCEYTLSSKIKQINSSIEIIEVIPDSSISTDIILPNKDPNKDCLHTEVILPIKDPIKDCLSTAIIEFKDAIALDYENLLYDIDKCCEKSQLNILKRHLNFYIDGQINLFIKFHKKSMTAVFTITYINNFSNLDIINNKSNCKLRSDGYNILVNPTNISLITELLKQK
jgi:hypothetical protein